MLTVQIPGREALNISHLILDYNGTIAEDGRVIGQIVPLLEQLHRTVKLYVITADTHGTAAECCKDLPVEVLTFPTVEVGRIKAEQAQSLSGGVACIGNGYNDIPMAKVCDLSICVIGREGCCGGLIGCSDVVVTSIQDALNLLLRPERLRATLRT